MKLHKTKKLLHSKEAINKRREKPKKWEKIFTKCTSTKGLAGHQNRNETECDVASPVILVLGRQRQEDHEFKPSLVYKFQTSLKYIARIC
jgi:hypothetical protein